MKQIITDNTISSPSENVDEKLKASAEEPGHISDKAMGNKPKKTSLLEEKKAKLENTIVKELNQFLAIVHTSSTYILIEKSEIDFVLDSKSSLLTFYENQVVPELSENKKRRTKAQIWLLSPHRRTFKNIVFNPKVIGHYDDNFNIWRGFAVAPNKGDCSYFWNHLRLIICGGKESHYIYVRKWLAHLFQKPWLIGTALVLRGKQGTGKGTFINAIGKLLGPHFAPLASLDQILGRFNSHLKNAILIFADEAIWGGNKKEIGTLKSLITEPRLFIEAKGRDGYWIDNFKHLVVSSNEDWAVHLDPDDRRFFVLDISNTRKEDLSYFNEIHQQLEKGGYEALMYDLQNEDITEFDPRIMPENFSGFDMKLEGASSIDRFIYTSLKEGRWDHSNAGPSLHLEDLLINTFYDYYKNWCEYENQKALSKEQVGKRLRTILPSMQAKRCSNEEDSRRRSKYTFPSLEKCRSEFEDHYKQSPSIWEEF